MKIRIEIEIGKVVIADEFCMPDAHLAQAIGPSALLNQIEAGLWSKMAVSVDKALAQLFAKPMYESMVPEPRDGSPLDPRFDVA